MVTVGLLLHVRRLRYEIEKNAKEEIEIKTIIALDRKTVFLSFQLS